MEYKQITLEIKEQAAVLTLNRPDIRNAITDHQIIDEIVDACEAAQQNDAIRVLVLTGAGTAFSAGGNVKDMYRKEGMFSGDPGQIRENYRRGIQRIPRALYYLDIPSIAAVNGPAIGAGCDLACMCDIRVGSEGARFGETFASVGIIPGDGGAFFLPRVVGFAKACEMAFTCRVIDAHEALKIGLLNEIVPSERLLARSLEIAAEIAKQPPRVIRLAKRLFSLAQGKSMDETLELSAAYQALCHSTPEHTAALEEFFAKHRK